MILSVTMLFCKVVCLNVLSLNDFNYSLNATEVL